MRHSTALKAPPRGHVSIITPHVGSGHRVFFEDPQNQSIYNLNPRASEPTSEDLRRLGQQLEELCKAWVDEGVGAKATKQIKELCLFLEATLAAKEMQINILPALERLQDAINDAVATYSRKFG